MTTPVSEQQTSLKCFNLPTSVIIFTKVITFVKRPEYHSRLWLKRKTLFMTLDVSVTMLKSHPTHEPLTRPLTFIEKDVNVLLKHAELSVCVLGAIDVLNPHLQNKKAEMWKSANLCEGVRSSATEHRVSAAVTAATYPAATRGPHNELCGLIKYTREATPPLTHQKAPPTEVEVLTFSENTVISHREHEYGYDVGVFPWKSSAFFLEGIALSPALLLWRLLEEAASDLRGSTVVLGRSDSRGSADL